MRKIAVLFFTCLFALTTDVMAEQLIASCTSYRDDFMNLTKNEFIINDDPSIPLKIYKKMVNFLRSVPWG